MQINSICTTPSSLPAAFTYPTDPNLQQKQQRHRHARNYNLIQQRHTSTTSPPSFPRSPTRPSPSPPPQNGKAKSKKAINPNSL